MPDVAIISALYGDYDSLKTPPPQTGDVECVLVTDNPDLESDVWRVVYRPKPHMKPRMASKHPRMLPHYYTDAAASIWVDMTVQITSPDFAVEAAEAARDGVATWPHPWNPDLIAEISESLTQPRYQGQLLVEQIESYFDRGLPTWVPVRHTAVVARAHNATTERLGHLWAAELEWSAADQVSFPWACQESGVNEYDLPADQAFLYGYRTPPRPDPWLSHNPHHLKGYEQ